MKNYVQNLTGTRMATLNMGVSYDLTIDEIERLVEANRIGNYAFGYLNNKGVFIVCYVGRSDTDLRERMKHGVEDMLEDPSCRYERFKFSYANSVNEAYEKECRNYHDFGGPEGYLRNKVHPAKPSGYYGDCPVCGE